MIRPSARASARQKGWHVRRGRHLVVTVIVLTAMAGALAGCASTTKSTGADTLEGGVKLPSAATPETGPTTVNVTLGDTARCCGSDESDRVTCDCAGG